MKIIGLEFPSQSLSIAAATVYICKVFTPPTASCVEG